MIFYLGTHLPHWLESLDVPLFISRRRLCERKSFPRARGVWALDSGGFTELNKYGVWSIGPKRYAKEVRLYRQEIGQLQWAAAQDWMCEPQVRKQTGLTVKDHQTRTTHNYLELMSLAPDLPWVPVLQGWESDDYMRHIEGYYNSGIELHLLPRVGLGSVCRRQNTDSIIALIHKIKLLRLHTFGFKTTGVHKVGHIVYSSDSLAWSRAARWEDPLWGCDHMNCANCMKYALLWRDRIVRL